MSDTGAIAAQYPDLTSLAPMLASSAAAVPGPGAKGGPFAYEPKWDGFRSIVLLAGGEVEILSRNGKSMARYFPDVLAAVREELPDPCVVDGEIVLVRDGRLDFDLLGQRIHPAASGSPCSRNAHRPRSSCSTCSRSVTTCCSSGRWPSGSPRWTRSAASAPGFR